MLNLLVLSFPLFKIYPCLMNLFGFFPANVNSQTSQTVHIWTKTEFLIEFNQKIFSSNTFLIHHMIYFKIQEELLSGLTETNHTRALTKCLIIKLNQVCDNYSTLFSCFKNKPSSKFLKPKNTTLQLFRFLFQCQL